MQRLRFHGFFSSYHYLVIILLFVGMSMASPGKSIRKKLNFNNDWRFNLGNVNNAHLIDFDDNGWENCYLPHNFEELDYPPIAPYYRGIGWYRKSFTLDNNNQNKRIIVYFEGAMTKAEFWINEQKLTTHHGGFNPFSYDITDYCHFNRAKNVIAVKVDNTKQKLTPPEKPDNLGSIDYSMFGGIYRDVHLIITDNLYIPPATHSWERNFNEKGGQYIHCTQISSASATVNIKTWVRNLTGSQKSCKLISTMFDKDDKVVGSDETTVNIADGSVKGIDLKIGVSNPQLWFPWKPYLYKVKTVVHDGDQAVDNDSTRIGIRSLEWTKDKGVKCNGVSFKILGLNRHQTWPFIGHAVPDNLQRREVGMLKDAGCNFVRCSHYLQDDAFMDECAEQGILLWVEVAGWAYGELPPTNEATWVARAQEALRSNIRVSRNFASVAIWGAGINEAKQDKGFERDMHNIAHAEDPNRPSSMARNENFMVKGDGSNIFDLYGLNRFRANMPKNNPDPSTLGLLNTEHTGHTYPVARYEPEDKQIELCIRHDWMIKRSLERDYVHGALGWCAFDYYTGDTIRVHGMFDMMHIPKFAHYLYQSQSAQHNYDGSIEPMVFIINYYRQDSPKNRKVYSNCDQVRLFRNNSLIATQDPDNFNLKHPYFTFKEVEFQAGNLKAEGLINGQVVATHTVYTPGQPTAITLAADPSVITANGSDMSRIIARIVDNNGQTVPLVSNKISFSLSGSGTLVGNNPHNAEGGVYINLLRAPTSGGTATITASSSGLNSGSVTVKFDQQTAIGFNNIPPTWLNNPKLNNLAGKVYLEVYSLAGRLVYRQSIQNQFTSPKTPQQLVNLLGPKKFANGLYFLRLHNHQQAINNRMLWIK